MIAGIYFYDLKTVANFAKINLWQKFMNLKYSVTVNGDITHRTRKSSSNKLQQKNLSTYTLCIKMSQVIVSP